MPVYLRGNIWWYKFRRDGRAYYKSSESEDKEEAKRLLKIAMGDVARGRTPAVIFNQVTLGDLAKAYLADYKIKKRKTLKHAQRYIKELKKGFGDIRVAKMTTGRIREYIEGRKDAGLANGSINRELTALKRMFKIAAEEEDPPRVERVPKIPMLAEDNVRKGFFEYREYRALYDCLADYLKGVLAFAYFSGWRISEILNLKWSEVDLEQRRACILVGEAKNKEGRQIYLDAELCRELKILEVRRDPLCPYVFQRIGKKGGERIKRFTDEWESALRKCGFIPRLKCRVCGDLMDMPSKREEARCKCGSRLLRREGRIFHDLRRSAIRENVRAGIPESVAMKISGHKTRSVFERYNITDERDLRQAAEKRRSFIEIQGRGDNRGDSGNDFGLETQPIYGDNGLKSFESVPAPRADKRRVL